MPMIYDVVAAAALCLLIGIITYRKGLLTSDGAITAAAIGIIIALTHPSWLVLLFGFLLAGLAVTRYRFLEKKKKGLQEGKSGERGWKNVVSTGSIPAMVALLSIPASPIIPLELSGSLFLVAIATAASDTLASEMGVLSGKARLITTMKPVEPGTNGGVSAYGTLWSVIGAFTTAFLGGIFLLYFSDTMWSHVEGIFFLFALIGLIGFTGCMLDSLLGATLENRGIIGKGTVNFLSELLSVIIFVAILYLFSNLVYASCLFL